MYQAKSRGAGEKEGNQSDPLRNFDKKRKKEEEAAGVGSSQMGELSKSLVQAYRVGEKGW